MILTFSCLSVVPRLIVRGLNFEKSTCLAWQPRYISIFQPNLPHLACNCQPAALRRRSRTSVEWICQVRSSHSGSFQSKSINLFSKGSLFRVVSRLCCADQYSFAAHSYWLCIYHLVQVPWSHLRYFQPFCAISVYRLRNIRTQQNLLRRRSIQNTAKLHSSIFEWSRL